jgi:hypothetical protein
MYKWDEEKQKGIAYLNLLSKSNDYPTLAQKTPFYQIFQLNSVYLCKTMKNNHSLGQTNIRYQENQKGYFRCIFAVTK